MNTLTTDTLGASQLGQNGLAVGCATCWAAKYCAFFSVAGPQPPLSCPLLPQPAAPAYPATRT